MLAIARKILAEQLNISLERITTDIPYSELGADSMDIVEVIVALEDIYDIKFPEDDLEYYPNLEILITTLFQYRQEVQS